MKNSRYESKQTPLQHKHIPQRSCIACRKCVAKKDLIRLILAGNTIEIDPTGKKPGRGVYLCSDSECWEKALKKNRLEHNMHVQLSTANRQSLLEYSINLKKG